MQRLRPRLLLLAQGGKLHKSSRRAFEPSTFGLCCKYSQYPEKGVFQPDSPALNTHRLPSSPLEQQSTYPLAAELPPRSTKQFRRWSPRWYSVVGAVLITGFGSFFFIFRETIVPFYTAETANLSKDQEAVLAELEEFPMVRGLREQCHLVDGKREPLWHEWTAYQGLSGPESRRDQRLTSGPLGSRSGVSAQKVFWNESQKIIVVFVNFGKQTIELPHSVHKGIVTTICDETLGRLAIKSTPAKTAVTAHLEVRFARTVVPGKWYTLTATTDPENISTDRKIHVIGELAACDAPKIPTAVVEGLFVVPKTVKLSAIEVEF